MLTIEPKMIVIFQTRRPISFERAKHHTAQM